MINRKLKRIWTDSIRNKLITFFIMISILPTLIIGITSYYISLHVIQDKAIKASLKNLDNINDSVEYQIESMIQVSDAVFVEKSIKKVMKTNYVDTTAFNIEAMEVVDYFNSFFQYSNMSEYISSIILLGDNMRDIAIGNDAYTISRQVLRESELYKDAKTEDGKIIWTGTHKNWATIQLFEKNVISLTRLIKDEEQSEGIGVVFVNFWESVISDLYTNYEISEDGLIIIIDEEGRLVSSSKGIFDHVEDEYPYLGEIKNKDTGYFKTNIDDSESLIIYCTSEKYGWKIIEQIPFDNLLVGINRIRDITIVVLLLLIVMVFIFSLYISERITRPIRELQKTMKLVEKGNLEVIAKVYTTDEVGQLSSSFNYMIQEINSLFDRVMEENNAKKEAQYNALIAQVNPHFLYNTLNSIKWMAIIKKADNIKNMVTALGRLLEKSIKDVDKLITINEELELVKDYIYIQKFRYKDRFTIEYAIDEATLDYKINKFMLQPIIENAIFHGLEPKEEIGDIKLNILLEEDIIRFRIEDNGVGMADEEIKRILESDKENVSGYSRIGIKNVDERIKRLFGESYGVSITSVLDKYTIVEIIIPIIL